jgi:hypothetical protein
MAELISQARAAKMLGISPSLLTLWQAGKRTLKPDIEARAIQLLPLIKPHKSAKFVNKIVNEISSDPTKLAEIESIRARSSVAERTAHNRLVAGSIPAEPIINPPGNYNLLKKEST